VANRKVRIEDSTTTGLEIITPISNAWISHVFHRNTYSYILLGNDDGDSLPYGEIRAEKDTQSSFVIDALNGRNLRLGCDGTTFVGIDGGVTPIVNIENSAVLFCQDATVLTVDIQNDLRVQNRIIALDNDTGVRIENDTTTCGLTLRSPMTSTGIYTHITMGDFDPGSGAVPVGHIIARTPHTSVDPYMEIQATMGAVILTSMNVQMVKVNSGSVVIEGDSTINGAVSVGGDVLPDSDYAYRLGGVGSGWSLVYSDIVAMNYLYAATEGSIKSFTDIIPNTDNAYNLGADTTDWASVHTRYIKSNNVLDIQGENAMVIRSQTAGITLRGDPISIEKYLGVVDFRIVNPPTTYPGSAGEQWRVWCDTADGNRLKLRTLFLP
jgi:hypothetical protein